jgi:hypothetical protein
MSSNSEEWKKNQMEDNYGIPGAVRFDTYLPYVFPLSRAGESDMTGSDIGSLCCHPLSLSRSELALSQLDFGLFKSSC